MPQSQQQRERAKRIIYEIIGQADPDYHNEVFVNAAFYYAHLKYAADQPGYLSTWPMVKMPHGPGIEDENGLLNEIWSAMLSRLSAENAVQFQNVDIAGQVTPPLMLPKYAPDEPMADAEMAAIRWGVEMAKKTAATVDSRAWRDASLGQEVSIYTDALPDDEYGQRLGSAEATARALAGMWRGINPTTSPPEA